MDAKEKKAMLKGKQSFIKNMPRFTSCKTAYKKGFQDALEWIKKQKEEDGKSNVCS